MTTWLIVAALIGGDGVERLYRPTVIFHDLASCQRAAQDINARWHANNINGLATCERAAH